MCPSILYALDLSAHIETWKQGIHLKLYLSSVCHKVSEDRSMAGRAGGDIVFGDGVAG